ncbi:carbohydrate kinase [Pseudarthrobacter sp. NIBRBAC000502772]|uniref:carbohydrate kinase family protein n=1 Tax=Pseudarthrobacter sp. NIBRBAC000502772 TaxID=2590775 RepID=UPI00113213DF|nr:carbohydrate kinase [Pseudarthrobacter sp. NIBRBAC000502772]QDG68410.1 carbohydrate kinase [Pseudarthrobacter sp. NIBRBAC000502772]
MITVIGEALVDIISDPRRPGGIQAHPGGSPLNVAVGVARLGLATNLVTHYADDPPGHMVEEHLSASGVTAIRGGSARTSTAIATLGPDGGATYAFDISWDINGAALPALEAVQDSKHVHTGSIAAVLGPGDQATYGLLEAARERATISFDPNCRPAIGPDVAAARTQAERFVAASDIVKASDEDLAWLYPHRTPEESLAAWLELGPALVALTRGASGPVILARQGRVEMAAEPVTLADTVGAGDSFMAALISGLDQLAALGTGGRQRLQSLSHDELHALAAYANAAAAITCSRPGANPPHSAELGPLSVPVRTQLGH